MGTKYISSGILMIGALFLSHTMYTMLNPNQRYMKATNLKKSMDLAQSQTNLFANMKRTKIKKKQSMELQDNDSVEEKNENGVDTDLMKRVLSCEDERNENDDDEKLDKLGSLVTKVGSLDSDNDENVMPNQNRICCISKQVQHCKRFERVMQRFMNFRQHSN